MALNFGRARELQRHLSDPSCPCILADSGEYCGPKHALGLHTLAKETVAMAPDYKDMLEDLAEEALAQHNALKDRIVCGQPHKDEKETVEWSRQWRKKIEPIYYHAACKIKPAAKLHQDTPIPRKLGVCKILKSHDDGDLTVTCSGMKYVVTTDGQAFKEIKAGNLKSQRNSIVEWVNDQDKKLFQPIDGHGKSLGLFKSMEEAAGTLSPGVLHQEKSDEKVKITGKCINKDPDSCQFTIRRRGRFSCNGV